MNTDKYSLIPVDFNPFEDGEIEQVIPAIEPQQEIWLACIIGGDEANCAYNESISLRLAGNVNVLAIQYAIRELLKRRDALRYSFSSDGEHVHVGKDVEILLDYYDLSSISQSEQDAKLTQYSHEDACKPFNLNKGTLIRFMLFKLGETDFLLRITAHHIICDGWSFGLILEDLAQYYNASAQGISITPDRPSSMKEYALNMQKFLASEAYDKTEKYWLKKFEGQIPVVELPLDYRRPAKRTYQGRRMDQSLSPQLVKDIKSLGKRLGCSLVNTLLSTFEIFIHKITGQQGIIVGLPTAGQVASECYDLVGHCVNFLPIYTQIDSKITFSDYLKHRKSELLMDYEYQQITFGTLIKKLKIQRNAGQTPLVSIVFNVDMGMDSSVSFQGLQHTLISNPREYENFDLFLNATGSEESLILEWSYNMDILRSSTIRAWMEEFETLISLITKDADSKIEDLTLEKLKSNDKANYVDKSLWENLTEDVPITTTLAELINDSLKFHSEAIALSFQNQTFTYHELEERTNRFAHFLISKGVLPGDRIGFSVYRGFDLIIAILATLKIGATYVPLDITFPFQRLKVILDQADLKCVIFNSNFSSNFQEIDLIKVCLEDVANLEKMPSETPDVDIPDSAVAYILHTSGSTGTPKGVAMGQRAMVNLLTWQKADSDASKGTKTLQFSPITFDVSFQEIFSTLTTGGTLCLIDEDMRYDIPRLLGHIESENINRIFMPFVALQAIAENACASELFPHSIQEVITAGEQLKVTDHIVNFFSKIPHATLSNHYGPTETHVVTALKLKGDPHAWPTLPSIGKPIYNTNILILDEALNPVNKGEVGELCVSGAALADGYLGANTLTNERFIDLPTENGDLRIYRTGDLAKYGVDGNITFLGRGDAQVKIRGYRVELGEIEAAINKLSRVTETVVSLTEDSAGIKRLIAYVLLERKSNDSLPQTPSLFKDVLSSKQLKEWKQQLAVSLPEYMIPYDFFAISHFPLTRSGKIDRKALPKPEVYSLDEKGNDFIAPRNAMEAFITEIWKKVLGLDNISVNRDFFELGGYSLIAIKVMVAIEKETGKRLPLSSLFENSTIEKLAKLIQNDTGDIQWKRLIPIKSSGSKPPLYIIHGGGLEVLVFQGLVEFMDSDQPIYALKARGVDGEEEPSESIEEVANDYVSEILQHNPDGPFALAGYSSGGVVAYEMTQLLQKKGKDVFFLGLIDSYAFQNVRQVFDSTTSYVSYLLNKWMYMGVLLFKNPKLYIEDKYFYIRGMLYDAYKKVFHNAQLFDEAPEYLTKAKEIHLDAHKKHKIKASDCHAYLFRAENKTVYTPNFESNGWKPFLLGGLTIHKIPGHHLSVFQLPAVRVLGEKLQVCIDESQQNHDKKGRNLNGKPSANSSVDHMSSL